MEQYRGWASDGKKLAFIYVVPIDRFKDFQYQKPTGTNSEIESRESLPRAAKSYSGIKAKHRVNRAKMDWIEQYVLGIDPSDLEEIETKAEALK
jgi:hypothetical protein